jgi:hypothetical protein
MLGNQNIELFYILYIYKVLHCLNFIEIFGNLVIAFHSLYQLLNYNNLYLLSFIPLFLIALTQILLLFATSNDQYTINTSQLTFPLIIY